MNELVILALVVTAGVYLAHRYGPDWNFVFMLAFFAGIPSVETGIAGYIVGASLVLSFVGIAYMIERVITGEWKEPAV
jgi:hypothetical protein